MSTLECLIFCFIRKLTSMGHARVAKFRKIGFELLLLCELRLSICKRILQQKSDILAKHLSTKILSIREKIRNIFFCILSVKRIILLHMNFYACFHSEKYFSCSKFKSCENAQQLILLCFFSQIKLISFSFKKFKRIN